jgi:hypothetical protein
MRRPGARSSHPTILRPREPTEYHIVRAERHLGYYTGEARKYDVDVASLPKDATDVAVLVQLVGQGAVVAAVSHSLL